MDETKELWRYLFKLPLNIFNNEQVSYEINPIPCSDQKKVVIFGGKNDQTQDTSVVYIYLELTKELNDGNRFNNLQSLLNVVYMETGLPTYPLLVKIDQEDIVDNLILKFGANNFYYPDRSYSGTASRPNHIARVQSCVDLMHRLNKKDFDKLENALNTYVWALELRELPNPHLKYTLYMTLFLSAINQLANEPLYCRNQPICEVCDKKLAHQLTGEKQAIEYLMRELLTGDELSQGVAKIKTLYSELRSSYLHSGKLSGQEKEGGFLFDFRGTEELIVDEMELVIACRQLFEQFLIKRQST